MSDNTEAHGQRTIRDDGSVRLPEGALDRLDLAPGDDVRLWDTGDEIVLVPWTDAAVRELVDE